MRLRWRCVVDNQNGGSGSWSRQQRRVFNRLVSFCTRYKGLGYQLIRVDLTTAVGGEVSMLRRRLQELRRRVERDLGYADLRLFVIETTEGNGVLHMIWGWKGDRELWIPQAWLSDEWEKIHGAPIVYIRKMNLSTTDIRRVGRYFALQYLSDQRGALVRMSYSWRRGEVALGKSWEYFKSEWRKKFSVYSTWCGLNPSTVSVTWYEFLDAWGELLLTGRTELAGFPYVVWEGVVQEMF
jgi:hypothetical protein